MKYVRASLKKHSIGYRALLFVCLLAYAAIHGFYHPSLYETYKITRVLFGLPLLFVGILTLNDVVNLNRQKRWVMDYIYDLLRDDIYETREVLWDEVRMREGDFPYGIFTDAIRQLLADNMIRIVDGDGEAMTTEYQHTRRGTFNRVPDQSDSVDC